MPTDVRTFFEAYRRAFDALDGAAVAALYAEPAAIAQDGTFTLWPTRRDVQDNMDRLCQSYRQRGYAGADFDVATYLQQGPDYAIADLRWRIEWTEGQAPWEFSTTYNLVRTDQGWRVLVCTAYTEGQLAAAG